METLRAWRQTQFTWKSRNDFQAGRRGSWRRRRCCRRRRRVGRIYLLFAPNAKLFLPQVDKSYLCSLKKQQQQHKVISLCSPVGQMKLLRREDVEWRR